MGLAEVASLLGYHDQSSSSRAFKEWRVRALRGFELDRSLLNISTSLDWL